MRAAAFYSSLLVLTATLAGCSHDASPSAGPSADPSETASAAQEEAKAMQIAAEKAKREAELAAFYGESSEDAGGEDFPENDDQDTVPRVPHAAVAPPPPVTSSRPVSDLPVRWPSPIEGPDGPTLYPTSR